MEYTWNLLFYWQVSLSKFLSHVWLHGHHSILTMLKQIVFKVSNQFHLGYYISPLLSLSDLFFIQLNGDLDVLFCHEAMGLWICYSYHLKCQVSSDPTLQISALVEFPQWNSDPQIGQFPLLYVLFVAYSFPESFIIIHSAWGLISWGSVFLWTKLQDSRDSDVLSP